MLNTVRTWNAWFSLSSQAALLGLEAQSVMALRFIRFAAGGPLARSETGRMIAGKGAGARRGSNRRGNCCGRRSQQPSRREEGSGRL